MLICIMEEYLFKRRFHYSSIMFIATIGMHPSVIKCGMDGNNRIVLHSVNGMPVSLAVHPSKTTLYWADPSSGTISSTDYNNLR